MGLEWEVWVGLALGLLGLLVSTGSWIWAWKAKTSADAAQQSASKAEVSADKAEKTSSRIEQQYEELRDLYSQKPVFATPVSWTTGTAVNRYFIQNNGPGKAYNVQIRAVDQDVQLTGKHAWEEMPPGDIQTFEAKFLGDPALNLCEIHWMVSGQEKHVHQFQLGR